MYWQARLYMGTWQLGGGFKKLPTHEIEDLIKKAWAKGIRCFDTAPVYGGGLVEEVIGKNLPGTAVFVTKIPARQKPSLQNPVPITSCYSRDIVFASIEASLKRLKRDTVDTLLFHNWLPDWKAQAIPLLEVMQGLKAQGLARHVGVSLPNGFVYPLPAILFPYIDVVEAPYNLHEKWIVPELPRLVQYGKEVLLRSLFLQGRSLDYEGAVEEILSDTLSLRTSVVIGMTTEKQIAENVAYVQQWR